MKFTFRRKRITGMLTVVPARELKFLDEMKNFNAPEARSIKLKETMGYDLSQGCAGFVIGLIQAFKLLEQESIRKVVLINSDVLSRKASPKDRNIYPLIGDAAAITVVERDSSDSVVHANLKMDGTRNE